MTGRYAVTFLFLTLPPDQVDVNVHPTKAEVRFRDASAVYHLVFTAVKERLRRENLVPRLQAATPTLTLRPSNEAALFAPHEPWKLSAPPAPGASLPFTAPPKSRTVLPPELAVTRSREGEPDQALVPKLELGNEGGGQTRFPAPAPRSQTGVWERGEPLSVPP